LLSIKINMNIKPSNGLLAYICNDFENVNSYEIVDNKCYYKGDFIGEMNSRFNSKTGALDVFFMPVKPIEFINVNITITKDGTEFNKN